MWIEIREGEEGGGGGSWVGDGGSGQHMCRASNCLIVKISPYKPATQATIGKWHNNKYIASMLR